MRVVTAAACACLLLVGCSSDDPAPAPLPPVTAEPSPSPTSAALPDLPPETEGDDAEAATAFARYYLEVVVNEAYRTGDPAVMEALSDPGCGGCNNLMGQIRGYVERGETVEGGDFVVVDAAAPGGEDGDTVVDMIVSQTALRRVAANGAVLEALPAGKPELAQLRVVREASGWKVYGLRFPDAGA